MPDFATSNTDYIGSSDYKTLEDKLTKLKSVLDEKEAANVIARRLRYSEIEVEAERRSGRLAPDELFISQHVIDTNIKREQSSYVQFVVQSPRAVILKDNETPSNDTTPLEMDATAKLRYDGYQIPMFSNIDGMEQNGYAIMEVVYNDNMPGDVEHEVVAYGDFAVPADIKNIQDSEFTMRNYYYSRTKLLELSDPALNGEFNREQVLKLIEKNPPAPDNVEYVSTNDRSLFRIQKVMFRLNGVVHAAWCCPGSCDGWLRDAKPVFIGRRRIEMQPNPQMPDEPPVPVDIGESYETNYPYILFPYLISENGCIAQLKGRAYLDQDTQEAATSLVSSYCTGIRRSTKLMFGRDGDDPNTIMQDKNLYFKDGAIIDQKVKQFTLNPPPAECVGAISLIMSMNQNETSQVNFAVNNRKDSRKTATEIQAANQEQSKLTTVQVVLFSNALRELYQLMFGVIQSRVLAKLITVSPELMPAYARNYTVKPAGDVDVIEREKIVQTMMQAWPIVATTPIAGEFFIEMISKMFPERAAFFTQMMRNAMQQQQAQAQAQNNAQAQAMNNFVQQMAQGIVGLAKKPEMFSDTGKIHALPVIQSAAEQIEKIQEQSQNAQQPQQKAA